MSLKKTAGRPKVCETRIAVSVVTLIRAAIKQHEVDKSC